MDGLISILGCKEEQDIRRELTHKCQYHSYREANWILIQNTLVFCFSGKRFYVTDKRFIPYLMYESTSYITACGASDSGKYAMICTARNPNGDEDSNAVILFDVKKHQIIKRGRIEIKNDPVLILIDEQTKTILFYMIDAALGDNVIITVKCDFDFRIKACEQKTAELPKVIHPDLGSDYFGISAEERFLLYQNAIDEIGNEWEKELDERNKRRAGIEQDGEEN